MSELSLTSSLSERQILIVLVPGFSLMPPEPDSFTLFSCSVSTEQQLPSKGQGSLHIDATLFTVIHYWITIVMLAFITYSMFLLLLLCKCDICLPLSSCCANRKFLLLMWHTIKFLEPSILLHISVCILLLLRHNVFNIFLLLSGDVLPTVLTFQCFHFDFK